MGYIGRTPTGSILTSADIADGSISTSKLEDNAVTTAKITDNAVTAAKYVEYPAYRNLIINGDMSISQRTTSESSVNSIRYSACDRWYTNPQNIGTYTISQSTDVPTGQGFGKSYKIACTTADASPSASDIFQIQQRIEGQNLQLIKKGTSNAESITLSFWVKSNLTDTFGITLQDNDNSRIIGNTFTINSANTWEKKTLIFAGDTTGALDNDNANSLQLQFCLGTGSTYTGTDNTSWGAYANAKLGNGVTGNIASSTSNEFYLTGVQLEVGTSASDFEFLPKDINLQRCMRYYQIYNYMGNPGSEFGYSLPIRQSSAGNRQWMITTTLPIGVRTSSATLSWDSARTGSAGSAYDGSWLYESASASNRWTAPTNTFQSKADGDTYSQLFNSISSTITDNTNFTSGETTTFSSRLIVDAEL